MAKTNVEEPSPRSNCSLIPWVGPLFFFFSFVSFSFSKTGFAWQFDNLGHPVWDVLSGTSGTSAHVYHFSCFFLLGLNTAGAQTLSGQTCPPLSETSRLVAAPRPPLVQSADLVL